MSAVNNEESYEVLVHQYLMKIGEVMRGKYQHLDAIKVLIQTVRQLHDADFAGTIDADLDMGEWTPGFYDTREGWMGPNLFDNYEKTETFVNWIEALRNLNETINMSEADIEATFGPLYENYRRLHVKSVIGIPFTNGVSGFLVIKNPRRFADKLDFTKLLCYGIANEIYKHRLYSGTISINRPEELRSENDVFITFFGGMNIIADMGRVTIGAEILEKSEIWKILALFVLNRHRVFTSGDIEKALSESDFTTGGGAVRQLIYRFRLDYPGVFPGGELIHNEKNSGYCLSRNLNIITDLDRFDRIYNMAITEADTDRKLVLLRRAMQLYGEGVLPRGQDCSIIHKAAVQYRTLYYDAVKRMAAIINESKPLQFDDPKELWKWM